MSFVNEDDIMTINSRSDQAPVERNAGRGCADPVRAYAVDEAMGRFGSDKPDTRFGLKIVDVTDILMAIGV